MYQARASEFIAATPVPRRAGKRRRFLLIGAAAVALLAGGTAAYSWYFARCGNCAPFITCTKRCNHVDGLRMLQPKGVARLP
jgi:hypothetical protein